MATWTIIIPGKLPGLNTYINAERTHRQKAAALKRDTQDIIISCARTQLGGVKFDKPVTMRYVWIEPDRTRDKDNIAFARKFVQDALVKCGCLKNDGWKHIFGFSDEFDVDKANPRVIVDIIEEQIT